MTFFGVVKGVGSSGYCRAEGDVRGLGLVGKGTQSDKS